MRLLKFDSQGELMLANDVTPPPAAYAILSHTWGADDDEVTFEDIENKRRKDKFGYAKLWFCVNQAKKDGLDYCWVDTCCINKASHSELSEAITSMFRWYQEAARCYVYLSDVSVSGDSQQVMRHTWEDAFRASRWFTRGWTLQELLAPASVEFFSVEGQLLGNKQTLEGLIYSITHLPVAALRGTSLSTFSVDERLRWTQGRATKKVEDQAYCLLGIFGVYMLLNYGEGENAYERLKVKIKKGADSTLSSIHTHWTVTRTPNPLFTGRKDTLQALGSIISNALANPPYQDQCRIVVSGMGGQGKSEICLQIAHRFRPKFWGVFWIDVGSTSLAERSLLNLAQTLSLPTQTWEEACLGIASLKHPWLLVLDNADNPGLDYQPYIPSSPLGVVIVTSRNEECQQYATVPATVLEGLSADAARDLLLKAARVPVSQHIAKNDDAARVAVLLQSHPLALIQAGTYISRGHCQLDQYPAVYGRQRQRLLQFRPTQAQSRYRDVYATFEASADALKQSTTATAGDALELLPLLAVCGASQFPLSMFRAGWEGVQKMSPYPADDAKDDEVELLTPWHVCRLPALLDTRDEVWDSFRLIDAVQALKAFALVSTEDADESMTVSMHPLVHAWTRDRQHTDERHTHWLSMGCVVAFARVGGLSRTLDRQLQAHIESVVEWDVRTMFAGSSLTMVTRVLVHCGWLLNQMRSDSKLLLLIHRLLAHLRLDAKVVVQAWLGLFELAARNLYYCGKSRQAIGLLEQVVELRKQSAAADHPDQLASQHALAGAYQANGQVKEAVALLEEVVQIKAQSLAADHPSRLASQHALAGAYVANGQVEEAVALLEEVVQIESQSLAADHPDRLASQHELAGAYQANGQVKEAVALLEEVVQIKAQSLAADHPDRLASQLNLAVYLWEVEEHQRAYDLMGQVVECYALKFQNGHPYRDVAEEWLRHFRQSVERNKVDIDAKQNRKWPPRRSSPSYIQPLPAKSRSTELMDKSADLPGQKLDSLLQNDGHTMQTIEKEVMLMLEPETMPGHYQAVLYISWDVSTDLLNAISTQTTIARVLTLTGGNVDAYAASCFDYIKCIWEDSEHDICAVLQEYLDTDRYASPDGSLLVEQCGGDEYDVCVTIKGTRGLLICVIQQLAWLATALRNPTNGLSLSTISFVSGKDSQYFIRPRMLSRLPMTDDGRVSCWHSLFNSATVAGGFPIPLRSGEVGLELPFDVLLRLSQVTSELVSDMRLAYYGYSTLLYPSGCSVDQSGNIPEVTNTVQWHFERSKEHVPFDCAEYLSRIERTWAVAIARDSLPRCRHFVGLCKVAQFDLATSTSGCLDLKESCLKEASTKAGARIENVVQGTGGLGIFTAEIESSIVYPQRIFCPVAPDEYLGTLDVLRRASGILWDSHKQCGWLVPMQALLLHMAHMWVRTNSLPANFRHVAAGPSYLTEVEDILRNDARSILRPGGRDNGDDYQLRHLIMRFWNDIRGCMLAQQAALRGDRGVVGHRPRGFIGWELLDFVSRPPFEFSMKVDMRSPSDENWPLLAKDAIIPVLFCQGATDVITNSPSEPTCLNCNLPQRARHLVASLASLEHLSRKYGGIRTRTKLAARWSWQPSEESILFESRCHVVALRICHDRLQKITALKDNDDCASLQLPPTGAVVFGVAMQEEPASTGAAGRNRVNSLADFFLRAKAKLRI